MERASVHVEPGDVHVWYAHFDENGSDSEGIDFLSDEERERESRLVFAKDRWLFRSAHRLVRSVLSKYVPRSPEQWRFAADPGGKPRIDDSESAPALRFNLSHTRGLAALAIALDDEIGVDVEQIVPPAPDLARTCFTTAEREWLGDPVEPERFFELWTLKEAYLKARGEGLSLPLQGISVQVDGTQGASVSFPSGDGSFVPLEDNPNAWQFHRAPIPPRHVLAVALRRPRSHPMQVTIREWRP